MATEYPPFTPTAPQAPLVGLTTTVPVEVILAAGCRPLDLNNCFITHPDPGSLVVKAEEAGLPATLCAWIKGMYAWCLDHPDVQTVIGVTQGDCSNTHALLELLSRAGRRVLAFDYPHSRSLRDMQKALEGLAREMGADLEHAEEIRRALLPLRRDLAGLDRLDWQAGKVRAGESFDWLVNSSDFRGDPAEYHRGLKTFLAEAAGRNPLPHGPRLAVAGVPPIIEGLLPRLESMGARVVLSEVPRQFAMPAQAEDGGIGLAEQYTRYTYPYDIFGRVADLRAEIARRSIDGVIHYTQTFCYRQMQDLILKEDLPVPVLTLEGNHPEPLDGRTLTRIEAFLEMLQG